MSDKTYKLGNILVNPNTYASKFELRDQDRDDVAIKRLEEHLAHRIRLGGAITYTDENGVHVIEDRDGIRPFSKADEFPSPPEGAELEIRELAFQHGVHANRSELDDWCEAVSANAGDDIQSDEIEQLVIALGRLDVVNGQDLTRLHAKYLKEVLNP